MVIIFLKLYIAIIDAHYTNIINEKEEELVLKKFLKYLLFNFKVSYKKILNLIIFIS